MDLAISLLSAVNAFTVISRISLTAAVISFSSWRAPSVYNPEEDEEAQATESVEAQEAVQDEEASFIETTESEDYAAEEWEEDEFDDEEFDEDEDEE